jgi:hypothetical protein
MRNRSNGTQIRLPSIISRDTLLFVQNIIEIGLRSGPRSSSFF